MKHPPLSTNRKTNIVVYQWSHTIELLPEGSGICLDLGAGDGRLREQIERKGWRWVGLDVARDSNLTLVADAQWLPFGSDSIQAVFTRQALEHIL